MKKYPEQEAGPDGWCEWVRPIMETPYRFACCDCGLVHDLEFRVDPLDMGVDFRARRNNRSTGQLRRFRHQ